MMGRVCFIACLLLSSIVQEALAATVVSGVISSDTTWTAGQSPYKVTADIAIANGATLTIQSDVVVYMAATTNLVVQNGSLKALGTSSAPIIITSDNEDLGISPVAGDWGKIQFQDGTSDFGTVLEHVNIKYGHGIVVQSAAPTFNYVEISDHVGPAMSIDLKSSPAGLGNSAVRNDINGILVPAGDVVTNVGWQMQGIPFLIADGVVSVGMSPAITSIIPDTVSVGTSVDAIITGTRLTGSESILFDDPEVTANILPGATDTSLPVRVTASSSAMLQELAYNVQMLAGMVSSNTGSMLTVSPVKPDITVTSINPTSLRRGESKSIFITGTQLSGVQVNTEPGLTVSDMLSNLNDANFTLTATASATLGVHQLVFENSAQASGTAAKDISVRPALPTIYANPSALVLPANSVAYPFSVGMSGVDDIDHTFSISVANTSVATVTPSTFSIVAGQTQSTLNVTGLQTGGTTLTIVSDGLVTLEVPIFITADFIGSSTARAPLLGVDIATPVTPDNSTLAINSSGVGVVMGSAINGMSPKNLTIDTGPEVLTVTGVGLDGANDISIVPNTGLTLGAINVSSDGSSVSVPVTIAADAPTTTRRVVVKADTAAYPAITPDADRINIVLPAPEVDSVQPQTVVQDSSSVTFTVRGRNLTGASEITVIPADGITVGGSPIVNSDGTQLTVSVAVDAAAPVGNRVVTVSTMGGISTAASTPANTFAVVNAITATYTPITATVLGVMKEVVPTAVDTPVNLSSNSVGVTFGSAITQVEPRAGSVGQIVTLQLNGMNLETVSSVMLLPDTGVTLSSPTIAVDGQSLTVDVTIAADAPQTLRKLQIMAGSNRVEFASPTLEQFQVAGPPARIDSVDPLYVQLGTAPIALTLRGENFQGASEVSIMPPDNVVVSTPPTVSDDGKQVTVSIAAGATAVTGPRTVVLTTPAGQTSSASTLANTITLTSTAGATFTPITSSLLGVTKLETPPPSPPAPDVPVYAPLLGVAVVSAPVTPGSNDISIRSTAVGVGVGPVAIGLSPRAFVQNSSGTLVVDGMSLDGVTEIAFNPADGIDLTGPLTVNPAGDQVTVPYSVSPTAPLTIREIVLTTANGNIMFTSSDIKHVRVNAGAPEIQSLSNLYFSQGTQSGLTINGLNLFDASSVIITPSDGVTMISSPVIDATGTSVSINLNISVDAPLSDRVVQVVTPSGTTSGIPTPASTLHVVD